MNRCDVSGLPGTTQGAVVEPRGDRRGVAGDEISIQPRRARRKARGSGARISLGTFDERRAQAIARALRERSPLKACRDAVHERDVMSSGPTESWHVYVPAHAAARAATWLAGWRTGVEFGRIEMRAALHGETFDDTARLLGYPHLLADPKEADGGEAR